WGSAAGITTRRNRVARETPKFPAARRYRLSIVCTPDVVCTTIGNTDEMKIRKIGEALPTPNQSMAMGIQAIGDMGRNIWKIGLNVANAPRTHPIHSPNGTANATA